MQSKTSASTEGLSSASLEGPPRAVSLERLWRVVLRRWPIICSAVAVCLLVGAIYIHHTPWRYSGTVTVDISSQNSQTSLSDLVQMPLDIEQNTRLQTEERIMESTSVLLEVADHLQLSHDPELLPQPQPGVAGLDEKSRSLLIAKMRKNLAFSILPGTTIASVTFTSESSQIARDVPNTLIDVYIGQDLGSGQLGTKRVSDWLQSQTQTLRDQVEESARKLADYQRSHNIIGADESQNVLVDKLRLMTEQLAAAQVDRMTKETNYRVSQSGNAELIGNLAQDPQLQALRAQQTQLQAEYNALNSRYDVGYPRLAELSNQLAKISQQITAEIARLRLHYQQDFQTAQQNEARLTDAVKEQEKMIFNLDEQAADYAILRHNAEATRSLYDQITVELKKSGIIDTLKSTRFRMVDAAETPQTPIAPRIHVILVSALIMGLFIGVVIAFIVDTIDDAVFSGEPLENETGLPILAVMPHIAIENSQGKSTQQLVPLTASGGAAEAFRGLRSSLQLGFGQMPSQLQVITSTSQGEGKSFVASNYARVLAQAGARVLLVDADLRRGSMHHKFTLSITPGLTNLLSERKVAPPFSTPEADIPTLHVLPRGPIPPNPTDLLASSRFMELIKQWRTEYDYIVIDSAPILPVADTLSIAQNADIVLLVVRVGVTSNGQFMRIVERLRRLNVPVKGIVLNDVTKGMVDYNYYYGGSKYDQGNEN